MTDAPLDPDRYVQEDVTPPLADVDITVMEPIADRDARMREFVDSHQVVDPETGEPLVLPLEPIDDPEYDEDWES